MCASKRTHGKKDGSFLDPFAMSDSLRNGQGETHHSWEPHRVYSNMKKCIRIALLVPLLLPVQVIDLALLNALPSVLIQCPRMPEDHFFAAGFSSTATAVSASSHS